MIARTDGERPERVLVTGIGVVCPAGVGWDALAAALREGRSGLRPIEAFSTVAYPSRMAGLVTGFEPREFVPAMRLRRMDQASRLAVAAGKLAVADAGLEMAGIDPASFGIAIGTGGAGTESTFRFFRGLVENGPEATNPMIFPSTVSNAPAGTLGIELSVAGPNTTFAQRGNAAEAALICGARWIRQGRARWVLAGGVDEVNEAFFHAHARFGVLSPGRRGGEEGMRPFDRDRNGYVLGEGAGLLLLEAESSARKRGARVHGEVAGWGQATQMEGILDYPPTPEPIVRAMETALARAEVAPDDVGWCNASGNSTRVLDAREYEAAARVLREAPVPVSSVKSILGESLASGGVRAACSLIAMGEGFVPATVGLREPAWDAPLDLVRGESRPAPGLRVVLQDAAAEGGGCIALVLRKGES